MPVWQFQSYLNPNNTVAIPPEIAGQLHPSDEVRVVLVTGDFGGDADWNRLATEQFLQGYAPGDDIYDEISAG